MHNAITILGVDPGLQKTGWGIIHCSGSSLRYIACGTIAPSTKLPLAERLAHLSRELTRLIECYKPDNAAIEETFVTANGQSTLKLGQARGALLLTLALAGLPVGEYAATTIKKSLTGVGRAEKHQLRLMVSSLMPQARAELAQVGEDAIDALAIAICHRHHQPAEAA